MIDAFRRELELLGHAPDVDVIPAPKRHAPPVDAFTQTDADLQVYERDNPDSAWMLAESGVVEVER